MANYLPTAEPLSATELDHRLEQAVREHERSEKLICIYLTQLARRSLYREFGFENIYDYATDRFGFCRSKTRALLYLGRRLSKLPALTDALAKGRIGWTKAAKVASVATGDTDAEWTEKAVASSFRDLERELRDGVPAQGGRVSIYLTAEQASLWTQVLELCRKVSGEQIDAGLALEYIAGEFLATYQASADHVDVPDAAAGTPTEPLSDHVTNEATPDPDPGREATLCPDDRDGYRCQYPGCSVRAGLHVHHVLHRSRFGSKSELAMNDPANLVTLCWFHHRMLHAEVIGLTGIAPDALAWRRPAVMETVAERHEAIAPTPEAPEVPNVWQPGVSEPPYGTTPVANG